MLVFKYVSLILIKGVTCSKELESLFLKKKTQKLSTTVVGQLLNLFLTTSYLSAPVVGLLRNSFQHSLVVIGTLWTTLVSCWIYWIIQQLFRFLSIVGLLHNSFLSIFYFLVRSLAFCNYLLPVSVPY